VSNGQASHGPILVAGALRSGTTWIARTLNHADGVTWINEPDNEWPNVYALKAKLRLGRFPALAEGDRAPRAYERLWERSLAGFREAKYQEAAAWKLNQGEPTMQALWRAMCDHANRRVSPRLRFLTAIARPPSSRQPPGVVMVKSVHIPLAVEWVAAKFRPRMLVVLRHPLNVIASWKELGWGGCALHTNPTVGRRMAGRWGMPPLDDGCPQLQCLAWEVGLFTSALETAVDRHPDWLSVTHESLCVDPPAGFRRLFDQVGLSWSSRAHEFLTESNRPGSGYKTLRIAAEQPDRWKRRLTSDDVREVWAVLSRIQAPWVERVARDLE